MASRFIDEDPGSLIITRKSKPTTEEPPEVKAGEDSDDDEEEFLKWTDDMDAADKQDERRDALALAIRNGARLDAEQSTAYLTAYAQAKLDEGEWEDEDEEQDENEFLEWVEGEEGEEREDALGGPTPARSQRERARAAITRVRDARAKLRENREDEDAALELKVARDDARKARAEARWEERRPKKAVQDLLKG